tara:strand:- start:1021 stop:1803 length:783 start_codon:yes stop_codon:yes gene_type:complete
LKSTNHILDTALEISDQAAELIRLSSKKIKSFKSKGEISNLVTQTDIEADKLISTKIKETFPEHNIVSEELGSNNLHSDYTWYIDPIDGTNNFVHNYPSFAVSIGIFYKDNPFAGVVYDIPNSEKYYALKNQGSYCNDSQISVSKTKQFKEGLFVTGFIPYDEKYIDKNLQIIKNINLNSHGVRRLGAASLDMCHVAKGVLEGFWEYNLQPWDTAAGNIIVTEAGGTVSDDKNKNFNFDKCIIASNGKVHDEFVDIIQKS